MNPLEKYKGKATLKDFVLSQIKDIEVGESINLDMAGKSASSIRSSIQYVSNELFDGKRTFFTRLDENKNIWVYRSV